jgi:MFS family permease
MATSTLMTEQPLTIPMQKGEHLMDMTVNPGVVVGPSSPATERHVSLFEQINLSVFWIASNFLGGSLTAIILSSMVAKYFGDANKDINLTLVIIWGTTVALIVQPLVGALSDHVTFRLGRRRPFLIIGMGLTVLVLLAFAFAPMWFPNRILLFMFALLFLLLSFSTNLAIGPWGAIIADRVPMLQRGLASGFSGLFTLIGTIAGTVTASNLLNKHDPLPVYNSEVVHVFLVIALIQILFVAYTVLTVKETPLSAGAHYRIQLGSWLRNFLFKPSRYPDFSWVLLARLLMMLGVFSIAFFLQYYADDVLGGPHVRTILLNAPFSGEQFVGTLFMPIALLVALPITLVAGWASDRWGRKLPVYVSGAMTTIVCLFFILAQSQYGALIAAAFFGFGYGAYMSVDFALTTDVLPPTDEAGKFMGIWSAMLVLAQVIAITISGALLQLLHGLPNHLAYTVVFSISIVCFALGTLVIRQVKGAR